jgi:translation initiation factor IF-1
MKNNSDRLIFRGKVSDANRGIYKILLEESGQLVVAKLAGNLVKNHINITLEDIVDVEVSQYDAGKGRIIYRHDKLRSSRL